jgi:spermidine synthase
LVNNSNGYKINLSGVLYTKTEETQSLLVDKENNLIRLYFVDTRPTAKKSKSGIMSYINIQKPFDLQALYTQVMMLSLVWKNAPESIYVLGFGGGALSNTLHHYFPDALIENTEIDQHVINLSKRFFGISEGLNLRFLKKTAGPIWKGCLLIKNMISYSSIAIPALAILLIHCLPSNFLPPAGSTCQRKG